jgi:hypothetical protein
MASRPTPQVAPAVAMDGEAVARPAAVATLPLPIAVDHKHAVARPGDVRGRKLRRMLLAGDVIALCSAFLGTQLVFGALELGDLPLLLLSIPLWVLLAYGHRLYHLDSYRADYGAADEIGPVIQMATLWSWSMLLALSAVRPEHVPVSKAALFWVVALILPMALRSGIRAFGKRQVWYLQNALIIGPLDQATAVLEKILRHHEWGINVVACVEGPGTSRRPPARDNHLLDLVPVLGGEPDIVELVHRLDIDRVMLTPAFSESRRRDPLRGERDGGPAAFDHAPPPPHAHVAAPQASARPRSRRGRAGCPGAGARGLRDRDQARLTGARAVSPTPHRP